MNDFPFLGGPSNTNQAENSLKPGTHQHNSVTLLSHIYRSNQSLSSPTFILLSQSVCCSCACTVPVKRAIYLWCYLLRGYSCPSLCLCITAPLFDMAAVLPPKRTDLGSRGLQLLWYPQTTASHPTKGGQVHLLPLIHHGAGSNSPDQKQICTTPSSACRATPTPPAGFPFFVGGALLASTFSQGRNYFSETNREGFWCLL